MQGPMLYKLGLGLVIAGGVVSLLNTQINAPGPERLGGAVGAMLSIAAGLVMLIMHAIRSRKRP